MFNPVKGGSSQTVYGYKCQLPPVGFGVNVITGQLENIGVVKYSTKKDEQIWKRKGLPADWDLRERKESIRQEKEPDYYDESLEAIREENWRHRLCGIWIMINGKAVYLTGLHWYYLTWVQMDIGFPHYRDNDRKTFYVWRHCEEDPFCGGLISVQRRREGKTYKLGAMLLEYISRTKNANAGIQSKTAADSKAVFQKAVVGVFKKMPTFFRPVFDESKGVTPTSELKFTKTTKKGKRALEDLYKPELDSFIDWKSSELFAMDGRKETRHGEDEVGKSIEVNVYERWQVNRFCLDQDGEWVGKAWLVSTVEELQNGGKNFKELWEASDVNDRDGNGRTQSGLYRLFMPAYDTTFFDKFGMPESERAKVYYINQREGLKNNPRALSSIIRKNPFTETEMFRIDGDKCLYNSEVLNDRLDALALFNNRERGNFVWENGVEDSKVKWEKNKNGRFEKCWEFPVIEGQGSQSNRVIQRGQCYYPENTMNFVAACDPFSHSKTQDTVRRSHAAACVKSKYDPAKEDDPYNDAIICVYHARPDDVNIFHEDMIKMCAYYGCQILFENNKNNWEAYFIARGYEAMLIKLAGNNGYGVHGNDPVAQRLCDLTELQISKNIHKQHFPGIINDWLNFEFANRTPYDLAMASGYVFIADDRWSIRVPVKKSVNMSKLFRQHKISA